MSAITFQKQSISSSAAQLVLDAAKAEAAKMGKPMVIAIVDESGALKLFERMDNAPLLSLDLAKDKAYTAISFGMPSHEWHEFIKNDPPLLHGIVKTEGLVVFGGGYPIVVDGQIVGGIGVSGGHYSDDMQVAEAGLAGLDS